MSGARIASGTQCEVKCCYAQRRINRIHMIGSVQMEKGRKNQMGISKKGFRICMSILMAVIIALAYLNIRMDLAGGLVETEIGMTNRNIEWTGAGYDGIYGK